MIYTNLSEKKEVLREGFSEYIHDFLLNKVPADERGGHSSRRALENRTFPIDAKFLELEYKSGPDRVKSGSEYVTVSDKDRYVFTVAKTDEELRTVGGAMHNCVGWCYGDACNGGRCVIVYAKYRNAYKMCIEITPDFYVRQALGPANSPIKGESLEIFLEWIKEKRLGLLKAFGTIRTAPH